MKALTPLLLGKTCPSPEKQQQRLFAVAEQRRNGDSQHDAGQQIGHEQSDDGLRRAVGGIVEQFVMHRHDVEQRDGVDRDVDQRLSQHDRKRVHALAVGGDQFPVESEFAPCAADHADADQERLLDDDDDDRGHDERSVTQIGNEKVVRLVDDRLRRGRRLRDVGAFGDEPLELYHGPRLSDARHELLEHLTVHEEVAGVDIERHGGRRTAQQLLLVILRNVDHAVDLAGEEELFGLLHAARLVGHVGIGAGVEGADQFAARRGLALVDHADRDVAQHFGSIGRCVERRVDEDGQHHDQQYAAVGEDRLVFVADDRSQFGSIGLQYLFDSSHRYILPQYFSSEQILRRRGRQSIGSTMKSAIYPMSHSESTTGAPRSA